MPGKRNTDYRQARQIRLAYQPEFRALITIPNSFICLQHAQSTVRIDQQPDILQVAAVPAASCSVELASF